jgi:hypothetical protein
MSVFPGERCRQTQNKPRFDLAKNPLKCNRRQMMALIHNDMAVLCNEIFHSALSVQTLDYGNINPASSVRLPSTELPDISDWHA